MQWLVLYHLSRTNNMPALALESAAEALSRNGSPAQLCVANQFEPTPWMEVAAK